MFHIKIIFIVCLNYYFYIYIVGYVNSQSETDVIRMHFWDKCRKNSVEAVAYDEFQTQFKTFTDYLQYATNVLFADPDEFCLKQRPILLQAFKDVAFSFYKCLPSRERYLKDFIITSWNHFLEFLCKDHGRNIKNFHSSQGQQCRQDLEKVDAQKEITECMRRILPPSNAEIRKDELCDAINVTKRCFSHILDRRCPNFKAFQKLNSDFFDALYEPCNPNGMRHYSVPGEQKRSSSSAAISFTPMVLIVSIVFRQFF